MLKQFFISTLLFTPFLLLGQSGESDKRASAIADSVVQAMGGKANWDSMHYLRWTFFDKRTLHWNKWSGDVRIEIPSKKLVILTNLNNLHGKVYSDGIELSNSDSNAYYMDRAYKIWANDSYWLIMPFKLHDPGVILLYQGIANDGKGNSCFQLEIIFDKVGITPENKYKVYVSRESYLVTQWDYFEKQNSTQPDLSSPWQNYQPYGKLLLSDDRGPDVGKLTNISVMDTIPAGLFDML